LKIKTLQLHFLCFFIIALALPACKTAKSAKGKGELKERSSQWLLKKMNANKKQVDWFHAKALISYKDDYQGIKINSYVRIRKDSIIWMNLKKFGFEAARIQITPDSIFVLDRINKQYVATDFSYLSKQFQLPTALSETLNFEALQNIFIGNPVLMPVNKMKAATEADGRYKIYGEYDKVEGNYYLDGNDYELMQMTFQDKHLPKMLSVNYSNYQEIEKKGNFSYFRTIDLSSTETGKVRMTIDLEKIELDIPKAIKFAIPPTYKKRQ